MTCDYSPDPSEYQGFIEDHPLYHALIFVVIFEVPELRALCLGHIQALIESVVPNGDACKYRLRPGLVRDVVQLALKGDISWLGDDVLEEGLIERQDVMGSIIRHYWQDYVVVGEHAAWN